MIHTRSWGVFRDRIGNNLTRFEIELSKYNEDFVSVNLLYYRKLALIGGLYLNYNLP
ncbi:hypothetical protein [uncultured Formosa sp.]|uniref:hypothetical protein n=1 Tax=uncultured Formosa sp. TaxID=255435 RepID=UPI00260E8D53|nr:hypothetical protein [uncultured Formosa sp.]